jgi:DNA-directed RNA polymerase subunit H (RpoH/RPB5)
MEEDRSLFQIYKSEEDKIQIIIRHVLLMLSRRIYIDKDNKKQPLLVLDDLQPDDKGDNTYVVKCNNGEKFAFKIVFQKIITSGKQSALSEFIREYNKYKKIIIAKDYNNKIADFALKHGIQIFKESTMLTDIISYRDQPIFELLSPEEMDEVKIAYNLTPYTINKTVAKSDITVKYFGLKKNNVYRVIRYSPTSGYAINYRIVS